MFHVLHRSELTSVGPFLNGMSLVAHTSVPMNGKCTETFLWLAATKPNQQYEHATVNPSQFSIDPVMGAITQRIKARLLGAYIRFTYYVSRQLIL